MLIKSHYTSFLVSSRI